MNGMEKKDKRRIEGIQSLRGLAALFVMMYHIKILAEKNGIQSPLINNAIFGHMYYGVDIFFVISGFIMANSLSYHQISAFRFIKNRLIRIVPLYWCLSLLFFFATILSSESLEIDSFTYTDLIHTLTFTATILMNEVPIIDQGWSLEYEMVFYLLIGICLFFVKGIYAIYFAIFFLICLFCLGLDQIVLEFAYGVIIYFIVSKLKLNISLLRLAALVGAILFLIVSMFNIGNEYRIFYYGVPAALVVLGATSAILQTSRKLSLLGDISYSLYLSQSFFLYWLVKLSTEFANNYFQVIFLLIFTPLAGILLAYFVYTYLEKPLIRGIKSIL